MKMLIGVRIIDDTKLFVIWTKCKTFGMEMEMPEKNSLAEKYRYGFNGKENDREWGTAGLTQDYGFRLYNPALGKFLSVDPVDKNLATGQSYVAFGNNSILFTDPNGLDNIIYLVNLGGKKDLKKIQAEANKYFIGLGLETRVKIFTEDVNTFDYGELDPTDGVAVLGDNAKNVADYIDKNLSSKFADYLNKPDGFVNNTGIPETSNLGDGSEQDVGKNIIAIDYTRVYNSSRPDISGELNLIPDEYEAESAEQAVGFTIIHGVGHNAGTLYKKPSRGTSSDYDSHQDGGVMTRGHYIATYGGVNEVSKKEAEGNGILIKSIKKHFGTNSAHDNYGKSSYEKHRYWKSRDYYNSIKK